MLFLIYSLFFSLLYREPAIAAPCCSGSSVAPTILSGDDKAQLSLTGGYSGIVAEASPTGFVVQSPSDIIEARTTIRLDVAILIFDRWQVGGGLPIVERSLSIPDKRQSSIAIGDMNAGVTYELLPEWTYSIWKPKGFIFSQITLPTAPSVYDLKTPSDTGAIGQGFYALSLGVLLMKRFWSFDTFLLAQGSHYFGRSAGKEKVGESWGASGSLGMGYSPGGGDLRMGLRLQPGYVTTRTIKGPYGNSKSGEQLRWDSAFEASYLLADAWTINASYTDQSLIGSALNSDLSRGVTVTLLHRWAR